MDENTRIEQELKQVETYCMRYADAYTEAAHRVLTWNGRLALVTILAAGITTVLAGGTTAGVASAQEGILTTVGIVSTTVAGLLTTVASGIQKTPFASADQAKALQNSAAGYRRIMWRARSALTAATTDDMRKQRDEVVDQLSTVDDQAPVLPRDLRQT